MFSSQLYFYVLGHSSLPTTSTLVKSCKIQKVTYFTHFDQKNAHISGCKILHKYTSVTVTVHICIVTATLLYIILVVFLTPHNLSSTYSLSLASTPKMLFI